jgi:hypothetical protein
MLRLILDATGDLPGSWLLNPGGMTATGVLVFFLLALWKGWIHTDAEFQRMKAERDALREASDKYLEEFRGREREERKERAVRHTALGDS